MGAGGYGGVFRTRKPYVKGCFVIPLRDVFTYEAEIFVVIYTVEYAWKHDCKRSWLEGDTTYAVNLLRLRSCTIPWTLLQAWSHCLFLIANVEFQVSHIIRQGNRVADSLATYGTILHLDG